MNPQEAFNIIKRTIDLSLQSGVIKSIEDSKIVFDSLDALYKAITPSEEPKLKKVEEGKEVSEK